MRTRQHMGHGAPSAGPPSRILALAGLHLHPPRAPVDMPDHPGAAAEQHRRAVRPRRAASASAGSSPSTSRPQIAVNPGSLVNAEVRSRKNRRPNSCSARGPMETSPPSSVRKPSLTGTPAPRQRQARPASPPSQPIMSARTSAPLLEDQAEQLLGDDVPGQRGGTTGSTYPCCHSSSRAAARHSVVGPRGQEEALRACPAGVRSGPSAAGSSTRSPGRRSG